MPRTRGGRRHNLRFGDFEFDPSSRELVGPEGRLRLPPQPAALLMLLLESSGAVISRKAVRRHLWPDEMHLEFDQGINTCIKRLRSALDDRAETPRYIETVPRLGYRFLEPVNRTGRRNGLLEIKGGARGAIPTPRILIILVLVGLAIGACVVIWRALTAPPCDEDSAAAPIIGNVEAPPGQGVAADWKRQPHP